MVKKVKKTLNSEVNATDAAFYLDRVQAISKSFRGFTEDETAAMADYFSVMHFGAGQTVIAKGETGTWFGVLLSGTLEVEITPTLAVTFHEGALCGELSLIHI